MNGQPLASIIIPVYNGENYLKEAIDSALNQTYKNIEVIVVNDGSNDNGATEKIALSYRDRIRYFHKENGGVATALNLAIKEMKGEYFSWLSHDDMYYPQKIEVQIKALEKDGDMTKIVNSDFDGLNVNAGEFFHVNNGDTYLKEKLEYSVFPVLQETVHGCALLIHKSHFDRVGTFDEKLRTTQDYDLWFRMFRNQRTIYVNENLIITRMHDAQGTNTISCHQEEREKLHIGFMEKMTEKEMVEMYRSEYNFYYRMSKVCIEGKLQKSYLFAKEKLMKIDTEDIKEESQEKVKEYIKGLSANNADKTYIFGAGKMGMAMYEELKLREIKVSHFVDNDSEKWDKEYNGIKCISPEELVKQKDNVLIVVAALAYKNIQEQLKKLNCKYVTTRGEIERELFFVPPIVK